MDTIPYIVAGLVVLSVLGMILQRIFRALRRPEMVDFSREKVEQTWTQIEKTAEQGSMGGKLAIIEADQLLDQVLRSMMIPGDNLGQRLKVAAYKYPSIRNVWSAHKMRNQLVHEPTFQLSSRQVKQTLSDFKNALKALNVM